MEICAGCDRPILERYLLNVLDRVWHVRCVQCSDCACALTDKCFSRDGKLYCRNDFFLRFGTKCAGCLQGISPSDLVRRARSKVFHLKCFTCIMCRKELSTGEELYILDESRFLCKDDYLSSKLAGSDVDDEGDFDNVLDQTVTDHDYLHEDDSASDSHLYLRNSELNHINGQLSDINSSLNLGSSDSSHIVQNPAGLNLSLSKIPTDSNSDNSGNMADNSSHMTSGNDVIKGEPKDSLSDSCLSPIGQETQLVDQNPGSNCSSLDNNDSNNNKDNGTNEKTGNKRRGPRTTIKAKQLEILKASFNATPKPTRHIREQLAAETGLNMRVIQVWFQNRRSKERRMKQLSALGARRHFFRNHPRRMRGLRGDMDEAELMVPGYGYYNDAGPDFYPGYPGPGYGEFYPGPGGDIPPGMQLLPPQGRVTPPMGMELQMHHPGMPGPETQYLGPPDMMQPPTSPESLMHPDDQYPMTSQPPRSMHQFQQHPGEAW